LLATTAPSDPDRARNGFAVAPQSPTMVTGLPPSSPAVATLPPAPIVSDVDPVLVGIIAVLLLVIFVFFLLIRRTLKSFTEGMREGRNR
jgi:hypothetical protein